MASLVDKSRAFSLVEVLLAMGIFVVFAIAAGTVVLSGLDLNRSGRERVIATQFAAEGLEAARSIRNRSYAALTNTAATGITKSAGVWAYSGVNNTFGKYTRSIEVSTANRSAGDIVSSGGSADTDTKRITSTVTWNIGTGRNGSVSLSTYLTNFRKTITSWAAPALDSSVNLAANGNGWKVRIQGNYAYVVRTSGAPNFIILNISNTAAPTVVGSLSLSGTPRNIFVSGNFAYIASTDNASELQIVNISVPASPVLVGTYNASGNSDANVVIVSGTTAYLANDNGGAHELFIINVATPASPTLIGSINLTGNINDLVLLGNYVYAASSDNNQELQVVNVTTPATPTLAGTLNLSGNNDARSIDGFGSTVVLGRVRGEFQTINVTTPATPATLGTFAAGGDINDISLGNSNTYAFLATSNAAADFRVLNISTPASIVSVGTLNMSATQNGIDYNATLDRAAIVGQSTTAEFAILKPN